MPNNHLEGAIKYEDEFIAEDPEVEGRLFRVTETHELVLYDEKNPEDSLKTVGVIVKKGAVVMCTGKVLYGTASGAAAKPLQLEYEVITGTRVAYLVANHLKQVKR